jgi:hypothetical protein
MKSRTRGSTVQSPTGIHESTCSQPFTVGPLRTGGPANCAGIEHTAPAEFTLSILHTSIYQIRWRYPCFTEFGNSTLKYAASSNQHSLAILLIAIQRPGSDSVQVDMPCEIGQMQHQFSTKSPDGSRMECSDWDLNPGHCLERPRGSGQTLSGRDPSTPSKFRGFSP